MGTGRGPLKRNGHVVLGGPKARECTCSSFLDLGLRKTTVQNPDCPIHGVAARPQDFHEVNPDGLDYL